MKAQKKCEENVNNVRNSTQFGTMRERMELSERNTGGKKTLLGSAHRGINLGPHNWIQMQIQHLAPSGKANLNLALSQRV